ncbi:unnamed protein product [Brassica oleracea]|uniref:(rape) hypothetical protein n=1 Tax=Brassica napus TaxID=3708 RepID=A0A816QJL6_BRANA|nr:unnamed protein product [Brassica napus]
MVDVEQYRRMEARVQELVLEVQQLKDVVEKQGRKFEKWKTFVKGKSAIKKQGSVKSRGKRRTVEGRKGMELRSQDDEAEDDDDRVEDDVPEFSAGGTQGEGDERTPEQSSRSISEERPSLLVRLPAGDGVPLQWVEPGTGDKVVYRALHSQTFFVSEDEGNSVGGGSRDQGRSGDGLDASAMTDLDALVLAASGDMAGGRQSEENGVGTEAEKKEEKPDGAEEMGEQLSVDEAGRFQEGKSGWTDGLGEQGRDVIESERHDVLENVGAVFGLGEPNKVVIETEAKEGKAGGAEEMGEKLSVENENDWDKDDGSQVGDSEDADITGVASKMAVLDVSDTSDEGRTARDEPIEQEGELAAVLLAKDQYIRPAIVPTADANLKVGCFTCKMHINASGYDLDNEFFIDLATPCKWVSSTHMDVLADYVGRLHAEDLRGNRAMLVAPWFSAHLQVKERSFKVARHKTRIATDLKLTKFLTMEGKKWGVDVDTLGEEPVDESVHEERRCETRRLIWCGKG